MKLIIYAAVLLVGIQMTQVEGEMCDDRECDKSEYCRIEPFSGTVEGCQPLVNPGNECHQDDPFSTNPCVPGNSCEDGSCQADEENQPSGSGGNRLPRILLRILKGLQQAKKTLDS